MRNFIYKNINFIGMAFTTVCFVVGMFAGNRYITRRK